MGEPAFAYSRDRELQERLTASGVQWLVLSAQQRLEAEAAWRKVYGQAFIGMPRLRHGSKAELEFLAQDSDRYVIIPFSGNVDGLPVCVRKREISGYECRGPLVSLGAFGKAEFFISPPDMAWSMILTHEDYAYAGPYFIRAEWIP